MVCSFGTKIGIKKRNRYRSLPNLLPSFRNISRTRRPNLRKTAPNHYLCRHESAYPHIARRRHLQPFGGPRRTAPLGRRTAARPRPVGVRGRRQPLDRRHGGPLRGLLPGAPRPAAPPHLRTEAGALPRPECRHRRQPGRNRRHRRRRRADQPRFPDRLCRAVRQPPRRCIGRRQGDSRIRNRATALDVALYRKTYRQPDRLGRTGASLSRRAYSRRGQHGVPTVGAGALRSFQPRPGEDRRPPDRRRGERPLRPAAPRRQTLLLHPPGP